MAKQTKKKNGSTPKKTEVKIPAALKNIKPIKISVFDAHRIIGALRKMEANTRSDNQDESLSNKVESTLIQNDESSIPFLTKLSILNASGRGGDPKDLKEDADLSDFLVNPEHFLQLRAFLLAIITKAQPSATISINEIKSCSTVQDVIDIVTQKIG